MHDDTPISGAIPMRDPGMPKKTTKKKAAPSIKDGNDSTRDANKASAGSAETGNPLNPYCTCAPCRCTPPCTCGLRLKARETRTEWDDESGSLRHVVTEVWVPKREAKKA